ncbi:MULTISPECIES: hypothetical protein [Pseudomonas]|uniref:hypothetical protein n=1 Tax=Pseudomonas TaxID=286 RepID=UPI0012E07626|nr:MULTISPECIES: hypothetical protein [Pseudomonas]
MRLKLTSLFSLGYQLLSEQFLCSFRTCISSIGNAQLTPQGFDSLTMLRGFPGMLAIFGNEALVIPD